MHLPEVRICTYHLNSEAFKEAHRVTKKPLVRMSLLWERARFGACVSAGAAAGCRCKVLAKCQWPCVLWSLGAGCRGPLPAGCCCMLLPGVYDRVRFGACVLMPLQGTGQMSKCLCRAGSGAMQGAAAGCCCQMCMAVCITEPVCWCRFGRCLMSVAVCALELGCWGRCRVLLPDARFGVWVQPLCCQQKPSLFKVFAGVYAGVFL